MKLSLPKFSPNLFRSEDSSENGASHPYSTVRRRRLRMTVGQANPSVSRRPWLYLIGGVGITGAMFFLFRPTPIAVEVATIERGKLSVAIVEEGQTRVRDRYVVSAPVTGYLQRLELTEGDTVTAGERIAQIDPLILDSEVQALLAEIEALKAEKSGVATLRPKTTALAQAEANILAMESEIAASEAVVSELQARLAQARHDRDRAQFLYRRGAISEQALESEQLNATAIAQNLAAAQQRLNRTQADLKRAQARRQELQAEQQDPDYLLAVYEAQIRSLEARLAEQSDRARRTNITAPGTGQVLRISQKSEQFVEAGLPLIELGDPKALELVVDVLSSDAVQIEVGDRVVIEQWGGNQPLAGKVQRVEPAAFTKVSALGVEEQRVNVIIDFREIPSRLGDQYRMEAQIIVWEEADALQVPISALFRCEESWCVFVAENQTAQRRSLVIGQRNAIAAEIKSGLKPGEKVILYPSERIDSGSAIKLSSN